MRLEPLLALGAAVIVTAATGCNAGAAGSVSPSPGTGTDVTVIHSVGRPVHRRSQVEARCPVFAQCRPARALGSWVLRVARRLTCDPPGGGYAHPTAACAALREYVRLGHRRRTSVCACPGQFGIPGRARGVLAGRPVRLNLTACAACGLGSRASYDLTVLTPA
jgi:hypothetical protein